MEIVCYVVLCTAYFAASSAYLVLIWTHVSPAAPGSTVGDATATATAVGKTTDPAAE